MTTYYEKGANYYMDIDGLKEGRIYSNAEMRIEIRFEAWDAKKVAYEISTWDGKLLKDGMTTSINVINRTIKKYGLQFTAL